MRWDNIKYKRIKNTELIKIKELFAEAYEKATEFEREFALGIRIELHPEEGYMYSFKIARKKIETCINRLKQQRLLEEYLLEHLAGKNYILSVVDDDVTVFNQFPKTYLWIQKIK